MNAYSGTSRRVLFVDTRDGPEYAIDAATRKIVAEHIQADAFILFEKCFHR